MSSIDLFNQARVKREEAMVLFRNAETLSRAATCLGATFGSVIQSFGSETWRGPNATRVFHLLNDCHCNLRYCVGQIFDDATGARLRAREAEDVASILESDGRMMARVEAEAEAARQRAAAEAVAAQARAAQAAAQAASKEGAAASAKSISSPPAPATATTAPALTFAPITTTTTTTTTSSTNSSPSSSSSRSSSGSGHDDSDYSGWY